jgi:hypothetical protein
LLFFPLKGRLTRLTPSSFSFVFIFLVTEAAIRCYSVWNGTEPFFVLLYCGNEQVIVRWVAFVKFISSDESILRFVYSYFVTEFRGLGEFPFLIGLASGSKKLTIRSGMIRLPDTTYLACSTNFLVNRMASPSFSFAALTEAFLLSIQ